MCNGGGDGGGSYDDDNVWVKQIYDNHLQTGFC
jgi:hypothetical protein